MGEVMEIHFTASDVADPKPLTSFLLANRLVADARQIGQTNAIELEWDGPVVRSGMWETIVDWIGRVDVSSIPSNVAATLIATYLWDIIVRMRGERTPAKATPSAANTEGTEQRPVLLQSVTAVSIVIIVDEKRAEFDALTVNQDALHVVVLEVFSCRNASMLPR
jgi:hypothetical protein